MVKDLYYKNFKTLVKTFENAIMKWKDNILSWIGRINIVKLSMLYKTIYGFNVIPIKIFMIFSQN